MTLVVINIFIANFMTDVISWVEKRPSLERFYRGPYLIHVIEVAPTHMSESIIKIILLTSRREYFAFIFP